MTGDDKILSLLKQKITKGEEDSFLVIDLNDLHRKLKVWKRSLPRVEPFYAVKCNDHMEILGELAKLGLSFDCASMGEISKILSLNVNAEKIIYANPCKQVSHLQSAEAVGVRMMTFDNQDELKKIKNHCPHAIVILRLATDDSKAICRLSQKFGARLDKVEFLLSKVKAYGLDFGGFSYHVGSGCQDEDSFVEAVHNARKAFDIAQKLGFENAKILDIGGGFSGEAVLEADFERAALAEEVEKVNVSKKLRPEAEAGNESDATESPLIPDLSKEESGDDLVGEKVLLHHDREKKSFPEVARLISKALDLYFPVEENYRIIAEPGRYFVHSCGTLAVNIIARRTPQKSTEGEGETSIMYYVNEGVYGAFSNTIYDHAKVIPNLLHVDPSKDEVEKKTVYESSIWGPSCDGLDCVIKSVMLPKLKVGSWLYFENMGAYTICAGSNFNGFKKPNVYCIRTK